MRLSLLGPGLSSATLSPPAPPGNRKENASPTLKKTANHGRHGRHGKEDREKKGQTLPPVLSSFRVFRVFRGALSYFFGSGSGHSRHSAKKRGPCSVSSTQNCTRVASSCQ